MKLFAVLIFNCFLPFMLIAQDSISTTICPAKKTFIIRKKKKDRPPQEETKLHEKAQPIKKVPTTIDRQQSLSSQEQPLRLPTLAGGEFGLMDIQVYRKDMDLKNWKFVVLEYTVSLEGWTTKINVLETNDWKLKAYVLRKLKKARWNPAISKAGKPIAYKMYTQVVIVKDRIYEEDYTNDY
ncbi:energy transducer TonB [Aureispira anguillae]|uniref:Uncharacterized protein n=1 Tax=Aureispira anguillae TaxID=2864201 RepID=A0A915YHY2_9BACT|nr:hypothetical protein [Aureispira anguillae]BDS13499.1 hypothetical protein AsAng_0042370 [Aureispira anguillae]